MPIVNSELVINFWFEESEPKDWFAKNDAFDKKIEERFLETYYAATQCELYHWRNTAEGRLAEIIVLDQFSRNMFRQNPQTFLFDSLAVILAQEAINLDLDKQLPLQKRKFLYMPFMHSESLIIHDLAVNVFSIEGLEDNYRFEMKHREIIERFGRYPHRNDVLGRESTTAEKTFLSQPGSSF